MRLMRTSAVAGRPVVTLAGEDVAQIKDVVYAAGGGAIAGFTLAGRGIFSGPLKQGLPWGAVLALGADAVMVNDDTVLRPKQSVLDESATFDGSVGTGGDILGAQVLTDAGVDLGTVVDVIIEVEHTHAGTCAVVGYEVEASEALAPKGTRMLIPLPDTLAASGEHLMVPTAARDFVSTDLGGFEAALPAFRDRVSGALR